ncbi:MAG: hypothetical protein ACI4N6_00720 [Eubacteriales bacterium]
MEKSATVRNVILVIIAAILIAAGITAWRYINGAGYTFKYVCVNEPASMQSVMDNDERVTNAFRNVLRHSIPDSSTEVSAEDPTFYIITHSGTTAEHKYNIYVESVLNRTAYIEDTVSGAFMKIRPSDFLSFFTLDRIAPFVDNYSEIPEVTLTLSGEAYTAKAVSATWRYVMPDGTYRKTDADGSAVIAELSEASDSNASLAFSALYAPEFSVTVVLDGEKIYEGDPKSAPVLRISPDSVIELSLTATWHADTEKDYYGTAEYLFTLKVTGVSDGPTQEPTDTPEQKPTDIPAEDPSVAPTE